MRYVIIKTIEQVANDPDSFLNTSYSKDGYDYIGSYGDLYLACVDSDIAGSKLLCIDEGPRCYKVHMTGHERYPAWIDKRFIHKEVEE